MTKSRSLRSHLHLKTWFSKVWAQNSKKQNDDHSQFGSVFNQAACFIKILDVFFLAFFGWILFLDLQIYVLTPCHWAIPLMYLLLSFCENVWTNLFANWYKNTNSNPLFSPFFAWCSKIWFFWLGGCFQCVGGSVAPAPQVCRRVHPQSKLKSTRANLLSPSPPVPPCQLSLKSPP